MAPNAENLSAMLYGKDDMRLIKRDVPDPADDYVLVKMGYIGICGTDIGALTKGRVGDTYVGTPRTLGHEAAGTIIKCGAKVKNLKPGDRVALEPMIPCRKCVYCKTGKRNLCTDCIICTAPFGDGMISKYFSHPEEFSHKLPEHVSLEEGAMMEPLACCIHAANRAGIVLGSRVLICGAGPIGLSCMMAARSLGATKICVTETRESRLQLAAKLGADYTLLVTPGKTEEELVEAIREKMEGVAPDITMECSGAEPSVRVAVKATKNGGTLMQVGYGQEEIRFPIVNAATREVDIKTIFSFNNSFPLAVDLVSSGRANMKALVSHRFPIEEAAKAFECAVARKEGTVKILISCDDAAE